MFLHTKKLQFRVRVERPDPVYARKLQELIGGKFGEMTVMTQYLFQGWNMRGDLTDERLRRVKDMLLDTGTEEIGHIEMLATCIGQLLDGASPEQVEEAAKESAALYAVMGGMNPHHAIVSGLGALPADSVGHPFMGNYATASGNLVADLYTNAMAEMQGRLQACRLYEMTTDTGVRELLSFLIARDHMHQNQWLAVIEELGGASGVLPVPVSFPLERELQEVAYTFINFSADDAPGASSEGLVANAPAVDGKGEFAYQGTPQALGEEPHLSPPPPSVHGGIPGAATSPEQPLRPPAEQESLLKKVGDALGGESRQRGG